MLPAILIAIAAFLAGAVSPVADFGIGSILTPLLRLTIRAFPPTRMSLPEDIA